jgi:hypothetical protein
LSHYPISENIASTQGGGVNIKNTRVPVVPGATGYDFTLERTLISGNNASEGSEAFVYSGQYSITTVYANNFNLFEHSSNTGVVGFSPGANDIDVVGPGAVLAVS